MIQNKYIIRIAFIGLFLNIVANMVLYRYFMIEEIILKQVDEQNVRIVEAYQTHIWNKYQSGVDKLKHNNINVLLRDEDFIEFAKASNDFFQSLNLQITLYNSSGYSIFTSNNIKIDAAAYYQDDNIYDIIFAKVDQYLLKKLIHNNALNNAYKGKTTRTIIPKGTIADESGSRRVSLSRSFIPIINNNSKQPAVDGVVEVDTDVTAQWQSIAYLEKKVLITFAVIFIIFFVIVMYNTSYAQRIINRQSETNKALEEAKMRAENESSAKTEFLANVSHELRTPLNAIIGFSEIMTSESYGRIENKQYKEYIQDINNSGKHLLSVINDILDFSKASADKLKVESVELDLNKLASSSMRFVKPRADEAKIILLENLPKEHIVIYADPKRLKQALLNLLSNSVKFTPENGSITLTIDKNMITKTVTIKVIDTGIGMSEKDIPKALSTFGQVDNSFSRKYEGTGLGLPLTKKLIELMCGKFDIQSQVGVGTIVTLTFKYDDVTEHLQRLY